MPIDNVAAELQRDGHVVARGVCHIVVRGEPEGGTISHLRWTDSEPDLTGVVITLHLADGRTLSGQVLRHARPEGITVLRFRVLP